MERLVKVAKREKMTRRQENKGGGTKQNVPPPGELDRDFLIRLGSNAGQFSRH